MRACVTGARMYACVRACMRVCVGGCMRVCMRLSTCVHACVLAHLYKGGGGGAGGSGVEQLPAVQASKVRIRGAQGPGSRARDSNFGVQGSEFQGCTDPVSIVCGRSSRSGLGLARMRDCWDYSLVLRFGASVKGWKLAAQGTFETMRV